MENEIKKENKQVKKKLKPMKKNLISSNGNKRPSITKRLYE